jgi:hypothetical protein
MVLNIKQKDFGRSRLSLIFGGWLKLVKLVFFDKNSIIFFCFLLRIYLEFPSRMLSTYTFVNVSVIQHANAKFYLRLAVTIAQYKNCGKLITKKKYQKCRTLKINKFAPSIVNTVRKINILSSISLVACVSVVA